MDKGIKKKVLVAGTGFGKVYINAMLKSDKYELAGILARGSDRSKKLAKELNVKLYNSTDEIKEKFDCACVIVPNAAGGGNGSDIAKELLKLDIPTLLEHPAHDIEIIKCLKSAGNTSFIVNPFYRNIEPVKLFLKSSKEINESAKLLNITAKCSINVLYDTLDIIGSGLKSLYPWKIVGVSGNDLGLNGEKIVNCILGDVQVTIIVKTDIDKNNPDHPMHLYHEIEFTYTNGKLLLANTHGPVLWVPFLEMPRYDDNSFLSSFNEGESLIPSAIPLKRNDGPSLKEIFLNIWPQSAIDAIDMLFVEDKSQIVRFNQFQLIISKIWSAICKEVGYYNIIEFKKIPSVLEVYKKLMEG